MTIGEIAKKSMEGRIYIIVRGKVYGVNGFSLLMYDDEPSYDFETSEEVIESRTAEWKRRVQDGTDQCSLCGRWGWRDYKYCPWCGAKMEGEGDGTD